MTAATMLAYVVLALVAAAAIVFSADREPSRPLAPALAVSTPTAPATGWFYLATGGNAPAPSPISFALDCACPGGMGRPAMP